MQYYTPNSNKGSFKSPNIGNYEEQKKKSAVGGKRKIDTIPNPPAASNAKTTNRNSTNNSRPTRAKGKGSATNSHSTQKEQTLNKALSKNATRPANNLPLNKKQATNKPNTGFEEAVAKAGFNSNPQVDALETNQYASRCPFCQLWKLKSTFEEHLQICSASNKSTATVLSPNDESIAVNKKESEAISSEDEALINYLTKPNAKKCRRTGNTPTPTKQNSNSTTSNVGRGRPKRKAHDIALKSFKDILNEEEKSRDEDPVLYKNFPSVSNDDDLVDKIFNWDSKGVNNKMAATEEEETSSSGNEDEVAQLANELIKSWDTKDLMKEVFDIEAPVSDELSGAKKPTRKAQNKTDNKRPSCSYCKIASCNDSVGIQNCLSCNYITYRKCDLDRHIIEKHSAKNSSVSNDYNGSETEKMHPAEISTNCQYSTPQKYRLERHKASQSGREIYKKRESADLDTQIPGVSDRIGYVSLSTSSTPQRYNEKLNIREIQTDQNVCLTSAVKRGIAYFKGLEENQALSSNKSDTATPSKAPAEQGKNPVCGKDGGKKENIIATRCQDICFWMPNYLLYILSMSLQNRCTRKFVLLFIYIPQPH